MRTISIVNIANSGITRITSPVQRLRWWIPASYRLYAQFRRVVPTWDGVTVVRTERREPELAGNQQRSSAFQTPSADEQRFEDFFTRYQQDIFGYLWRITGEEQAAYDLCQETFLRAWQHFSKVSAYEQPRAWLFRVATNLAINHQRHRSTHSSRSLQLAEPDSTGTDPTLRVIERDAVATALQGLPTRQRMALVLRVVYALPFEEIAATLGVSEAAAKMTLSRGREHFRRHYLQAQQHQQNNHENR